MHTTKVPPPDVQAQTSMSIHILHIFSNNNHTVPNRLKFEASQLLWSKALRDPVELWDICDNVSISNKMDTPSDTALKTYDCHYIDQFCFKEKTESKNSFICDRNILKLIQRQRQCQHFWYKHARHPLEVWEGFANALLLMMSHSLHLHIHIHIHIHIQFQLQLQCVSWDHMVSKTLSMCWGQEAGWSEHSLSPKLSWKLMTATLMYRWRWYFEEKIEPNKSPLFCEVKRTNLYLTNLSTKMGFDPMDKSIIKWDGIINRIRCKVAYMRPLK